MKYVKEKEKDPNEILRLPKDFVFKVFGKLLQDLGCEGEKYQELFGAVRRRDVLGLLAAASEFEPRCMLEDAGLDMKHANRFFRDYQVSAFLKKYPFSGPDTKAEAFKKFRKGEESCRLFNTENYKALLAINERHPDFIGVLEELKQDIENLLGSFPNIDCILANAKHGPGVSLGDLYKEGKVTSYYKWSLLPYSVTQGTLPYAKTAIESDPRWIGALDDWYRNKKSIPIGGPINVEDFWNEVFELVPGNRITAVPKTALTDRTIAIEPLMNVFIQLGVDSFIRNRLLRWWGYDINSQEKNQELAEEGSITGELVTVDLSNASETVALLLCALLFPPAWYDLFLDLRSPVGELGKGDEMELFEFQKISSMGNGFTFAVETVIFAALVRLSIRRTKSQERSAVFGDDIVIPSTAYPYLLDMLGFCGFAVNVDKTFATGPFRESCGKDFFLGMDVRPVFLKRKIRRVCDLFYLHNSLYSLQKRLFWAWEVDFSSTLSYILKYLPDRIGNRYYGPMTDSLDTHLFSSRPLHEDLLYRHKIYDQIVPIAVTFRRENQFFFRKLMVTLKPKAPDPFWSKKKIKSASGCAFDVTRRDRIRYVSVRCELPQGSSLRFSPSYLKAISR